VVKLDTYEGHLQLSSLQKFWRNNTSSQQTVPVVMAKISDQDLLSGQPKAQLKVDR